MKDSMQSERFKEAAEMIGDTYSEEETKRRADAALKRMLQTPHKPHKRLKDGQRK
jgi:hypothetical protein